MFGRLNLPLAAGLVAVGVLVVPPTALACKSGTSAVDVYTECQQTGGGGKPTGGGGGGSAGGPSGTQTGTSTPYISKHTANKLKKAGADGQSLARLVNGYGEVRFLQSHSSGAAKSPTAVGSAFDLGSGPTALLIVLAGTAILLLGATGVRSYRRR